MRFRLLFLFLSLPGLTQLPMENFDHPLGEGLLLKLRGSTLEQIAICYEIIYGTTDKTRLGQVQDAINHLKKHAEKTISPYAFPPDVSEKYLSGLIEANIWVKAAGEAVELQQRKKFLYQAYNFFPSHLMVNIAIIDLEWELGNYDLGDKILQRLLLEEPKKALWFLLVREARMTRRKQGIEKGIDILHIAEKLSFSQSNPASDLLLDWEKEIRVVGDNPEKLYELGALKMLADASGRTERAKHYYARSLILYRDDRKSLAQRYLEQTRKVNLDFFVEWAENLGVTKKERHKLAKEAKSLSLTHPKSGVLYYYQSRSPKLSKPEKVKLLTKALSLEPDLECAFKSLARFYLVSKQYDELYELIESYNEQSQSLDAYVDSIYILAGIGYYDKAYQMAKKGSFRYPNEHRILYAGSEAIKVALEVDENSFAEERVFWAYLMFKAGVEKAYDFDFQGASRFVIRTGEVLRRTKETNLMAANLLYQGGYEKDALPYYQRAVVDYPKEAFLHEMLGDSLFANDLMIKSISQYKKALELDPTQTHIQGKIREATSRIERDVLKAAGGLLVMGALKSGLGKGFRNFRVEPQLPRPRKVQQKVQRSWRAIGVTVFLDDIWGNNPMFRLEEIRSLLSPHLTSSWILTLENTPDEER